VLNPVPPKAGDLSPWGLIDTATPLGPEAVLVSTPSHGGIWISPAALARLDRRLQGTAHSSDGWYEEDCDWCIPYLALNLRAYEPDPAPGGVQATFARRVLERWHSHLVEVIDLMHATGGDDA